jgi:hypothetical protein
VDATPGADRTGVRRAIQEASTRWDGACELIVPFGIVVVLVLMALPGRPGRTATDRSPSTGASVDRKKSFLKARFAVT